MSSKKILLFLHNNVGGAERMTVLIGKMLQKKGYDVTFILSLWHTSDNYITDFIPNNFKIIYLYKGSIIFKIINIYRIIRKCNPDICFSSILDINNKLLLCKLVQRKPLYIIRSDNYLYTFSFLQRIGVSIIYRFADKIIAQTEEMRDEFINKIHISENKVIVLSNPIDVDTIKNKLINAISPYPNDGLRHIIAVGRFSYQKGFDILITAFSILAKKRHDIALYIIGSNTGIYEDEYKKIETLIHEKKIQKSVFCLGYSNNPYPYIKYADCFVLSSRWEGLPNVLIEAQYLGTPTAATKCIPIISRIIHNGENGFLASKEDANSLADAIDKTLNISSITSNYKSPSEEEYCSIFS